MTIEEVIAQGFVDVKGYEGHYMINKKGDIFSLKRMRLMTPNKSIGGYFQVHLTKYGKTKMYRIHRLVAETFIPNHHNLPQVNHKDENKLNNNVENLEWCTQTYNMNYNDGQKRRAKSRNYEDISKKRSNVQSKEVTQYDYDGTIIAIWKNAYIAEEHGYNRTMINQCCIGKKKSHKGYIWKYTNNTKKQIPKKPYLEGDGYADGQLVYDTWICPNCEKRYEVDYEEYDHCPNCGQCILWESEEE